MRTQPVVHLDCDPGHDDAIALLLGAYLEAIVSVSTVGGNAPLEAVTQNALLCAEKFQLDAPVGVGADKPLVKPPSYAPDIHGKGGLDGPTASLVTRAPDPRDAVELMIASAEAHPGLWIVATGPMTNVAAALVAHPRLRDLIGGIAFMGGSTTFGNWTPAAEFNIWCDPEAAHIVLSSNVNPIRMVGLNVTHEVLVGESETEALRALPGDAAAFVAELYEHFRKSNAEHFFDRPVAPLHDPCALLAVTNPAIFTFEDFHVAVDTSDGAGRGATIVDDRDVKQGAPPNVQVAMSVEHRSVVELVEAAVRDLGP